LYTRNFRRFETDGQLYQLQKEKEKELLGELVMPETPKVEEKPPEPPKAVAGVSHEGGLLGNLLGGIFSGWSLDDLILIGLTLYLLSDKNDGNDLLVILLVLLLT